MSFPFENASDDTHDKAKPNNNDNQTEGHGQCHCEKIVLEKFIKRFQKRIHITFNIESPTNVNNNHENMSKEVSF